MSKFEMKRDNRVSFVQRIKGNFHVIVLQYIFQKKDYSDFFLGTV